MQCQCRLSNVKYPQQKSLAQSRRQKNSSTGSVAPLQDTKLIFKGDIPNMRKSLNELDQCPHTHIYKQEWLYPISHVKFSNLTDVTMPVAKAGSTDESHSTGNHLSNKDTGEDSDDETSDGEGDDCQVLRAGLLTMCHLEGSPCQSKLHIMRIAV